MITEINIIQDNIIGDCNLLAVDSPLSFICEVKYNIEFSDINVLLYNGDDELIATYKAIVLDDDRQGNARVAFFASDIFKSYMPNIDDFFQNEKELVYVSGATYQFKIKFQDAETSTIDSSIIDIIACRGASQFGESEALESVFNNETQMYFGGARKTIYVYFYNDDVSNSLSIFGVNPALFYARDYDDAIFTDDDDEKFYIDSF
jgi:hypothetical protein